MRELCWTRRVGLALAAAVAVLAAGCGDTASPQVAGVGLAAESCMTCHNGSQANDYSGPGLENPHAFPGASNLLCTTCHGGNGQGDGVLDSHVPPPPEIGDDQNLIQDRQAYFNRLTLTGIDKFPDYVVDGVTWTALDYLQFVNPGDLRVVTQGRSCGLCHAPHADTVSRGLLATSAGVFSGATYTIGVDNKVPASQLLDEDTAADSAFRAVQDPGYASNGAVVGDVSELVEFPVYSVRNADGPLDIHANPIYDAANLPADVEPDNQVVTDSPLANLFHEQVAFTCGDCHLGSAGANNRYGDFRSSGCTACHMPYALSGRSGSQDPNVDKTEPLDPDDIDEPERSHVRSHRIHGVARTLANGTQVPGIDDYTCAGCHQGSNRTVMQYWGIRLDQNQDLRRGVQYPDDPADYDDTSGDTRLFDPVVGNHTFNGRNRRQYIRFEDYDGDGRDDTPEDVHYAAGLGCIDCHGSYDLHGGDVAPGGDKLLSHMEQAVAIRCESCHGAVDAYAPTVAGTTYDGQPAQLAVDAAGNPLRHVYRDANGDYFLRSRLTGAVHYVCQTMDVVVDSGKQHPDTGEPIYTAAGSFAMGRDDGQAATGLGPQQAGPHAGFSHADNVSCAACHSSWTNTCIGCHLVGEYDTGNNFSNITGDRIVFREKFADFVYQTPVVFQLGVGTDNKVQPITPNTETFFKWEDRNNDQSEVFAFTDRNGGGNNPSKAAFPALSHNVMMPHSIRGRVDDDNEGPRYCVACHLTTDGVAAYGKQKYLDFRQAMIDGDFAALDFEELRQHIGLNPGNQLDSPLWVHQAVGLGSGLFLFDEHGCPVNDLDEDDDRKGCGGVSPKDQFDLANVRYNLDRIVDENGRSMGSNNHPMQDPGQGPNLRDGAENPNLSGPLGRTLIEKLSHPDLGVQLDAWIDADGQPRGGAQTLLGGGP